MWTSFSKIKYELKSGVLQLTLGISLVISILCASIILLSFYNKLSFLDKEIQSRLISNASSGIQYAMANRSTLDFGKTHIIDLYGDESDTVEIMRQPWGIFELITAKARHGNFSYRKSAMITAVQSEIGNAAIYSPDNNAPLYLVGNTKITGTVYASERKFSTGYIDGKGFERSKLVEGEVKKSEALIPELDTTLISEIKYLFKGKENAYRLLPADRIPTDTTISFDELGVNYYFTNQSIDISDSLAGNFIIHSSFKVRIESGARLAGVLIIAPEIDIDKGFHGSVQCFATRSIIVGAESKLKYPSALVLMGGEQDSTIVIDHDAIVEGLVVIQGHDRSIGSKGVFKINKHAVFHGMAYINGSADIQGAIWGHITARSFQANVSGAAYGNHLLNAEIDGTKRSKFMPGSLLWANMKQLTIAKWIP
jgi:hypothetical protein